jgi:hypothetical protein
MTLAQIKEELGVAQLNLSTAKDLQGQPTDWMRHWDNDNRVAVSVHKDTVQKIVAGENLNLGLQTETRTGSQGDYTAHRLVAYTPAEVTL